MQTKEMNIKFQEGVRLFEEGSFQEGADIWTKLAKLGHVDSIEQLTYIFLDQKDFEYVNTLIQYAKKPNDPMILYLKARLIEESEGAEIALKSYIVAADAGSPNACLMMFYLLLEEENKHTAQIYLTQLAVHPDYLERLSPPVSFEQLKEELEDMVNGDHSNKSSGNILEGLAKNTSSPEEILLKLAKHTDPEIRGAVAENPSTRSDILMTLAKDKSKEVRERVASNTSTPVETLSGMAKVARLRETIARNTSVTLELLRELSLETVESIRSSVAQNLNTPPDVLTVLALDSDDMVRYRVAGNVNTPPESLIKLASDNNIGVRFSTALNLASPIDLDTRIKLLMDTALVIDEYGYGRSSLAENPNTPIKLLDIFSKDESHVVRCGVAVNPSIPVKILERLGRPKIVDDSSQLVQARVAQNPSTPASLRKEIIEALINDVSAWMRCHVAWNKLAPSEILRLLAKDKYADVRTAVARNPSTPVDVLAFLAENDNDSVKAALAENTQTPTDILKKLFQLNHS
jgi:hypothetical protein